MLRGGHSHEALGTREKESCQDKLGAAELIAVALALALIVISDTARSLRRNIKRALGR